MENSRRRTTIKEICPLCNKTGQIESMIICTSCFQWLHYNCLNFEDEIVNTKNWICTKCSEVFAEVNPATNPATIQQIQSKHVTQNSQNEFNEH